MFVFPGDRRGGYYHNANATARLIHGNWLDTGDRGYMAAGELYITGRVKDIIIRRGRHIYPDEIEQAVGNLDGVRKGCVAAFGTKESTTATERLVVVAETPYTDLALLAQLKRSCTSAFTSGTTGKPKGVMRASARTLVSIPQTLKVALRDTRRPRPSPPPVDSGRRRA